MPRKHLLIFPSDQGVDFFRAERSYDGVWLRSSQSTWLPHLLPAVYQSVDLADFSFSSFRALPMGDPSLMPLPSDSSPYQVLILAPIGEPYPTQYGGLLFHSASHPPCLACERFVPDAGGIKRVVQSFFSQEFIDGMRFPERRQHAEIWIRHSLKIHDMLRDAYDAPRWLREQQGLTSEEAAQRMAALRLPTPASQYHNLRTREHDRREAQAKTEEEAAFAEQAWKDAEAAIAPSTPSTPAPESPPVPASPEPPTIRELHASGQKKREKAKRVTQSAVRASKANEVAARAFAEKKIKQMEADGRL